MQKLFNFMSTPKPFKDTGNNIWTEPKISDFVFDSHFNPDVYGGSKEKKFVNETVNFINAIAPVNNYPKILDLGCGPGLYSLELSKKGYDVLGIDYSKRSINYAIEQAKLSNLKVEYLVDDMLKFHSKYKVNVCILIYRIFSNFSKNDRKILLQNIWNSLSNNGLLLLDVPSVSEFKKIPELKIWEYQKNEFITLMSFQKHSSNILLKKSLFIFEDNNIIDFYDWIKHFTLEEISSELRDNGFKILGIYGDVNGQDYTDDSDSIALLCQKI